MAKKRKKFMFKLSYVTILLVLSIGIMVWYSGTLQDELRKETRNTLREVSYQNALVVQKELDGDKNILIEIAERIGELELDDAEEILTKLKAVSSRYSFLRMGFYGLDGIAHATNGISADVSDREYFKMSMQGEYCVSDVLVDKVNGDEIIVFSAPIKKGESIIGGVFATYNVEDLKEIMAVTSFDGAGYTYIVQQDGTTVVESNNPNAYQEMSNIIVAMRSVDERNNESVQQLKKLLEEGESGYVIFYNEVGKYLYCTPLSINDWFLIDVVPVNVMENTSNFIMLRTYIICLIMIGVYTVIVVLILRDERKKKKQMRELLYVDNLTGGNTYAKFKEQMAKQLKIFYGKHACIIVDISEFKLVNELFGYEEGNKVLCHIWKVLEDNCKDGEPIGRTMADRFTIFLRYEEREEIEQRVMKIADEIRRFSIQKAAEYILHPVFGIYYVEKNDEKIEDMINCATLAHNIAKKEKGCIYHIYSDDIKEMMLQKKQLSDQMDHAYRHHQFEVFYQPKYDAETKELVGAEALVRWRKSDGTMISPGLFIPLAEETGFVCKLDKYVFREVCLAQKRWMERGMKVVPISVNLSRKHLSNPEFVDEYKAILDETGVPIDCVQLEITESAMFEKQSEFIALMERLHELGFVILMDDFGTGYSSLMMLKQIPIDVMKLDKTFVDDYNDKRGEQIIRCVMQMAQSLDISITAEGVETEDQYVFLRGIGCDVIQGYYFARPMPEKDYEKCMEE